jgi:hypothetical protein
VLPVLRTRERLSEMAGNRLAASPGTIAAHLVADPLRDSLPRE